MDTSNHNWARRLAFLAAAGLSMIIVAAVVLVPPYARLLQTRHAVETDRVHLTEAQFTLEAYDRLIEKAPTDEVLTQRLAWSRLGKYPAGAAVIRNEEEPPPIVPGTLSPVRLDVPPEPSPWVLSLGEKLSAPSRRRGLLALAGIVFVLGILLTSPQPRPQPVRVRRR